MSESFKIEVELPVAGTDTYRYVEISVDCEYAVENNGIGPYEYWGSKEIDRGIDVAVIENTYWNTTGFSPEEINLINSQIDKNRKDWEVQIMEGWDDSFDDRDDDKSFSED